MPSEVRQERPLKRYERLRFRAAADTNRATPVCSAAAAHTPAPVPRQRGARPATDTAQSPGPASRSQVEGRGGWGSLGKGISKQRTGACLNTQKPRRSLNRKKRASLKAGFRAQGVAGTALEKGRGGRDHLGSLCGFCGSRREFPSEH